jgi:hypothetical protein
VNAIPAGEVPGLSPSVKLSKIRVLTVACRAGNHMAAQVIAVPGTGLWAVWSAVAIRGERGEPDVLAQPLSEDFVLRGSCRCAQTPVPSSWMREQVDARRRRVIATGTASHVR